VSIHVQIKNRTSSFHSHIEWTVQLVRSVSGKTGSRKQVEECLNLGSNLPGLPVSTNTVAVSEYPRPLGGKKKLSDANK
jgi:hypothetical protein